MQRRNITGGVFNGGLIIPPLALTICIGYPPASANALQIHVVSCHIFAFYNIKFRRQFIQKSFSFCIGDSVPSLRSMGKAPKPRSGVSVWGPQTMSGGAFSISTMGAGANGDLRVPRRPSPHCGNPMNAPPLDIVCYLMKKSLHMHIKVCAS